MEKLSDARKKQLLDDLLRAIGSLKRATGIPDHPEKSDEKLDDAGLRLYTTDFDSAKLLAEFFHGIYYGKHTISFYRSEHRRPQYKDLIDIVSEPDGSFTVEVPLWDSMIREATAKVEQITKDHIAPTGHRSR